MSKPMRSNDIWAGVAAHIDVEGTEQQKACRFVSKERCTVVFLVELFLSLSIDHGWSVNADECKVIFPAVGVPLWSF